MSERRMFAKTIIDSDAFLEMPLSAQALYFHLSMRADDEGFINNPKKIQRMIGASDDDLKLLIAKSFVIYFESGIIVIKHWKIHNYIRGDRLHKTKYTEERKMLTVKENSAYTLSTDICQSNVSQVSDSWHTEVRLGKVRLNNSLPDGKESHIPAEDPPESADADPPLVEEIEVERQPAVPYKEIVELYHKLCPSFPRVTMLSEKRKAALRSRWKQYKSLEVFERLFHKAESSAFLKGQNGRNWSAKFDWLIADSNMVKVLDGNYDDGPGYEGRSRDRTGQKNPMIEGNLSEELDEMEIRIAASKIKDPEARRQYLAKHQLE